MMSSYELTSTSSSVSPQQQELQQHMEVRFSLWNVFKRNIRGLSITIAIEIILPLILYFVLEKYIEPIYAFIAASVPVLLMIIFKAIWRRAFDPVGFLICVAFLTSAIVLFITHNPTILLLENSFIMVVYSIVFAISMIPFHLCHCRFQVRPIAYYLYQNLIPTVKADIGLPDSAFADEQEQTIDQNAKASRDDVKQKSPEKEEVAEVYKWIYAHCSQFRRTCYLITISFSVAFTLNFLARLTFVLIHLPINSIVIYGYAVPAVTMNICFILSGICIKIERKSTLAYIKQWKIDHLSVTQSKRRSSINSLSLVGSWPSDKIY
jgi:hypothetical protein